MAPVDEPVPFNVAVVFAQSMVPFPPASAVGRLLLEVTIVLSEDEHPVFVFVTVRVYVPVALTVGVKVVAPDIILPSLVVHKYEILAPVDEPVPFNETVVFVQSIVPFPPASAVGSFPTFTDIDAHVPGVTQPPSPLIKYVVELFGDTVNVFVVVVPISVPPQEPV